MTLAYLIIVVIITKMIMRCSRMHDEARRERAKATAPRN